MTLLSGHVTGAATARITFSGPITAADFTPSWFFEVDDNQNGLTVTQFSASVVDVLFDGPIAAGAEMQLTNQPAYVVPGGDITLT